MLPLAPTLFSISTGWPRRAASRSLTARAPLSAKPPGENGTTIFTGFVGHCCAFEFREKRTKRKNRRNITLSSARIRAVIHVQRSPVYVLGARGSEPQDRSRDLLGRADAA